MPIAEALPVTLDEHFLAFVERVPIERAAADPAAPTMPFPEKVDHVTTGHALWLRYGRRLGNAASSLMKLYHDRLDFIHPGPMGGPIVTWPNPAF